MPSRKSTPRELGSGVQRVAVFTGAFDPITLGHMDVIRRGVELFGRLVVGVGSNPDKATLFTLEERVELIRGSVAELPGVVVKSFEGLAVHFVRGEGAGVILRGVRSVADMDYELTMARSNRVLDATIETVFLPAGEAYSHISSSLIRQMARKASREEVSRFVPRSVVGPLLRKFQSRQRG